MRAEVAGVKTLLSPYNHPVYFGDVPGAPTYPYVLLWGSGGLMRADEVDGAQDDLNDILGVTTVAANPDACLIANDRVRSYLLGKTPTATGRHVQPLRLHDSRPIDLDRDVTLPATNTHPAFAVDLYRLISEPA